MSISGESNKYKSRYAGINSDGAINYNEIENKSKIGDAIWETSTSGLGTTSWNNDNSYFIDESHPFMVRGGYYGSASNAGVFAYNYSEGYCDYNIGFRAVLIAE